MIIFVVMGLVVLKGFWVESEYNINNSTIDNKNNYSNENINSLIKIGCSLSLTGKFKLIGEMKKKSYALWAENTNQTGGVLGKKIQLVIKDDESNIQNVRSIYENLVNYEKCDVLFAPYSSGLSTVAAEIADKYGMPMLIDGAASDSIYEAGYKNVFGINPPASSYTTNFLELIFENNIKEIAIVYSDSIFSKSLKKGTENWANKLGIKIKQVEEINISNDNKDVFDRLKKQDISALIVCGHYDESIVVRKGIKNLNWYPKVFFATVGPALNEYSMDLNEDANLSFSSSQWEANENIHFPGLVDFLEKFKERYHETPAYHSAAAFASGVIFKIAVEKVGDLDNEKLRETYRNLEILTLLGRYKVNRNGVQEGYFPMVIQWQDSKKEIVWPKNMQTQKAIIK